MRKNWKLLQMTLTRPLGQTEILFLKLLVMKGGTLGITYLNRSEEVNDAHRTDLLNAGESLYNNGLLNMVGDKITGYSYTLDRMFCQAIGGFMYGMNLSDLGDLLEAGGNPDEVAKLWFALAEFEFGFYNNALAVSDIKNLGLEGALNQQRDEMNVQVKNLQDRGSETYYGLSVSGRKILVRIIQRMDRI